MGSTQTWPAGASGLAAVRRGRGYGDLDASESLTPAGPMGCLVVWEGQRSLGVWQVTRRSGA
jgi:hypothetical protein